MKRAALAVLLVLFGGNLFAEPSEAIYRALAYHLPLHLQPVPGGGVAFSGGTISSATNLTDDTCLTFGTTVDTSRPCIQFNTTQTPDTGMILTGTVSNHWVIAERQDNGFDFAHAVATDPTLYVHSHNQSSTQYLGIYHDGSNSAFVTGAGGFGFHASAGSLANVHMYLDTGELGVVSGYQIGWVSSSTNAAAVPDAFFKRGAAARIQMGADANGAVTAQQFTGPNGITGTDIAGGKITFGGQVGTGAGAGSQTEIDRALMRATGTTAQSTGPAFTVCESKTLSNTSATTTALATIALASNSAGAARITVSVQCNDGTNFDSDVVTSYVAFVNKAGAITVGTAVTTASAAANNSGSCTVAPTFTSGASLINVNVTPVITTIAPTTTTGVVNIETFGAGAVTCQ